MQKEADKNDCIEEYGDHDTGNSDIFRTQEYVELEE